VLCERDTFEQQESIDTVPQFLAARYMTSFIWALLVLESVVGFNRPSDP
jgi:hypothetical protein